VAVGRSSCNGGVFVEQAPTKGVEGMTPYEAWCGKKPAVHHLRTFGCVVYVRNTRPNLKKLENRGRRMVFIGYEKGSKAYRAYDPISGRVDITRDAVFDEGAQWDWAETREKEAGGSSDGSGIFTILYPVERNREYKEIGRREEPVVQGAAGGAEQEAEQGTPQPDQGIPPAEFGTPPAAPNSPAAVVSPAQFVSPPGVIDEEQLDDEHTGDTPLRFRTVDNLLGPANPPGYAQRFLEDVELLAVSAEESVSLTEALKHECWKNAMVEELTTIEENNTWTLTSLPVGRKAIGLKWVFKVKRDEQGTIVRHKARLVVKGYAQREGVDFDEVFASVARMEAIRLLIAMAAHQRWEVHHRM
jgi:hypothetical protein